MEGNVFEKQVKQAIKCLQDQLDNLKNEIEELKQEKEALEAENAQLKEQIHTLTSKKTNKTNKTMQQVFTAPLQSKNEKQQEEIDRLNELIKQKDTYISLLEKSLAKYNLKEAQLLRRFNNI